MQEVIRDENLLENVRAMGARLEQGLIERLGNHAKVGDIRGRGLFWAVELGARPRLQGRVRPGALGERTREARSLRARPGLLPDGRDDRRQAWRPRHPGTPYVVTAEQVDMIVERFGDAVDAAVAGL